MQKLLTALTAVACLGASAVQADTLDFEVLPLGYIGRSPLVLPNATLTSAGNYFYNLSDEFGGGSGGSICVYWSTCGTDLQIDFTRAISGLTLRTYGFNVGDFVAIHAYSGNTLLGTANVASDALVDFRAFSGVTRLRMDDDSFGGGFAYGSFKFDTVVPEPGTYVLMLAGLTALAAATCRRRPF